MHKPQKSKLKRIDAITPTEKLTSAALFRPHLETSEIGTYFHFYFSLIHLENLVDQIGTDHPFDTITELIEEVLGIDFSSFQGNFYFSENLSSLKKVFFSKNCFEGSKLTSSNGSL